MALYYDEILAGSCFGQINITPSSNSINPVINDKKQSLTLFDEFQCSIEELFYLAQQFLKEKQKNKEIQLKYDDNIRLIALSKQARIGQWNISYTQDVGFLDVIGNDRKQAWIALGDMSKEKAMEEYVKLLLDRCLIFRTYLETQHIRDQDKDRLRKDDETRRTLENEAERARKYEFEQISRLEKKNKKREEFHRKQIQDVLNQQTYLQFKAYAEQQYRDNRQAQEELIRQLQEQHFQQYMQQVYQQQLLDQQQQQQIQTKTNMEQQQPENAIPSTVQSPSVPTNVVPPPNIVIPPSIPTNAAPSSSTPTNTVPPSIPSNVITPPIPTNTVPPPIALNTVPPPIPTNTNPSSVPFTQNIPLQTMSQILPLGPAPAQLPPLVHPPPIAPLQSVINNNAAIPEIKAESIIPLQTQFETLSVNTPLEPIPPVIPQSSINNDLTQNQQLSSVEINNELNPTQELINGNPTAPLPIDTNATVNPTGESSLINEENKRELPNISPANMWTRKDVKEFKEQIRKEKDAVIKIGSGETVTVRVPTHEDGRCIFWEFSTDYYDLGFGLYFEWSKAPSNTVTVHVSDSSDEEEENEDGNNQKKDIEKGSGSTNKPPKPPQDEIVPIYRRDCHEEVYAGSHPYPGTGVYLLKFDNSYSLWRSKTLYYRVYYSK